MPVITTYMAKGGIPIDHPLNAGHCGIQVGQPIGNHVFLESDLCLLYTSWDFMTRINWYDENDGIVAAARKIRFEGDAALPESFSSAKSHYGMALEKSLHYFAAADLFLHDPGMTIEQLRDMLDIGKFGPNGLPV